MHETVSKPTTALTALHDHDYLGIGSLNLDCCGELLSLRIWQGMANDDHIEIARSEKLKSASGIGRLVNAIAFSTQDEIAREQKRNVGAHRKDKMLRH
jgi:hypothetical protein